jgi:hypothetical protein
MMTKKHRIVAVMVGVIAFSVPLFAHHGTASFDTEKKLTLTGTVTDYIWSNPHVIVKLDVKDDSGNVVHWVLESWNPVTQTSRGWTKNSFKAGDEVVADITPAKNDKPIGEFTGRIVINGKVLQEQR